MSRLTLRHAASWWLLVGVVALSIWLLARFKPYPYLEIWNFVTDGILVTLRIVATSFGFILLVSPVRRPGAAFRATKIIYGIASLYVELIRGIPLLVQLLFIWYALPTGVQVHRRHPPGGLARPHGRRTVVPRPASESPSRRPW